MPTLTNADLSDAHLSGVNLSGADLTDADLTGEQARLNLACGSDAKLPPDLTLKPCHLPR